MCGGDHTGKYVRSLHGGAAASVCAACGDRDRIYRIDPDIRRVRRLWGGRIPDLYRRSGEGADIRDPLPCAAAGGGESDLSSCCRRVGGTAFDLGAGGGQSGRQPDGRGRNADIYSGCVSDLRAVQGGCVLKIKAEGDNAGRGGEDIDDGGIRRKSQVSMLACTFGGRAALGCTVTIFWCYPFLCASL